MAYAFRALIFSFCLLHVEIICAHFEPDRCHAILKNFPLEAQSSHLLENMEAYVRYWDARPMSYDEPSDELRLLFQMNSRSKLSDKEESVMVDYLRGSRVNLAIRGHHDSFFNPVPLDASMIHMKEKLDTALPKLRSYSGLSFRGASISAAEFAKLKKGKVWADPGFLSTSVMYAKAQSFALGRYSHLKNVVFAIAAIDGKVVPSRLYHRIEGEVLFPRNKMFEILKIDKTHTPTLIFMIEKCDSKL